MNTNSILTVAALFSSSVVALTQRVNVGEDGLAFNPNSITAAVGDIVEFYFYPNNHSVAEGDFNTPCSAGSIANPIFSGFIPSSYGEAASVFQVTIEDTDPIWFYCSQDSHCQSGMVGVINPPATGNTLDTYTSASIMSNSGSTSPDAVSGGIVAPNAANSLTTTTSNLPATTADVSIATSDVSIATSDVLTLTATSTVDYGTNATTTLTISVVATWNATSNAAVSHASMSPFIFYGINASRPAIPKPTFLLTSGSDFKSSLNFTGVIAMLFAILTIAFTL